MKKLFLLLPFCMFLLLSCEKESLVQEDIPIQLQAAFSIKSPQKAYHQDLKIAVLQVQDSRCPQDVVCVWQGEVTVRLQVQTELGSQEVELTLRQPEPEERNEASVGNYRIILEGVSMPPSHKVRWKTEDYDVRLRIILR